MEWVNQKERLKTIAMAMASSCLTGGILFFSLYLIWSKPNRLNPLFLPLQGPALLKNDSSMDSLLLKMKVLYIHDAINRDTLKEGDRLLRIAIGRSAEYWQPLLNHLSRLNLPVFWKEAGSNKGYRSLYLGPIPKGEEETILINKYGLNRLKLEISRGVVEIISGVINHGSEKKVLMNFQALWSFENQ